jgi:hypothetical protein
MKTTPDSRSASFQSFKKSGEIRAQNVASSHLMELLTRIGYAARGLIYITMGLLAVQVALGKGGALASPQSAIAEIGKQPGGVVLLWGVLVGIIGYALWGMVRAIMDPLGKGHGTKGLLARFGFLVSAFGYAVLAVPTYSYISGASQSNNGAQTQNFMISIMGMPWGRVVIGLIGLGVLAGGLYQIYLGLSASFDQQFRTYALTPQEVKVVTDVGRFGTAARGVVFAIFGGLLSVAAYQANPGQAIGMDTALATIMHQPFGIWLLGIIAVGLIAFGFYSMLSAVWFRLKK